MTDFTMSSTFTVALTDLLDDIDFDNIIDVDSLKDSLNELEDAALSWSVDQEHWQMVLPHWQTGEQLYRGQMNNAGRNIQQRRTERQRDYVNDAIQSKALKTIQVELMHWQMENVERKIAAGAAQLSVKQWSGAGADSRRYIEQSG